MSLSHVLLERLKLLIDFAHSKYHLDGGLFDLVHSEAGRFSYDLQPGQWRALLDALETR